MRSCEPPSVGVRTGFRASGRAASALKPHKRGLSLTESDGSLGVVRVTQVILHPLEAIQPFTNPRIQMTHKRAHVRC